MKRYLMMLKHPAVALTCALAVLWCLVDFWQRVYISIEHDTNLRDSSVAAFDPVPRSVGTTTIDAWLQAQRRSDEVVNEEDPAEQEMPQLYGAERLGAMQVRVRGTFLSAERQVRVALIEVLVDGDAEPSLKRVVVGDALNEFVVTDVEAARVRLTDDSENSYEISVFAWQPEALAPNRQQPRQLDPGEFDESKF
ncbi:MAG: hypothetical protein LAT77_11270 [Aliidiomarina sp.]|uniref:hypothetical protein n=1 Tax=Aliidiomarina sp. TaxID=1872439 RepID=UPI0025C5991B|nr:hypothetical protein [Aliidiomarina sp.]MCH8502476.1 hypothetical protein [Aliidiomarina sp.]